MFVPIWTTLLLFVRGYSAYPVTSCYYGYCITLGETHITAEAGLCAVIPCSFTTGWGFTTTHLLWSKCEPDRKCTDSDIIFHTNKSNRKVQTEYKGRVSILEPDLSRGNCSIVINDLTESDSGSYQLRVNGVTNERQDGLNYPLRATVSVKGLTQKPTVMVPPLTEGQQSTLTCTAPGLCSGSEPEITWTWRGTGGNESQVTGNITSNGRQSSLTFNPSAAHHGLEVTCRVSFTGDIRTEETVTLNVTYIKDVKISGNPNVKEGETLNLTCSVDSFPPSLVTWTSSTEQDMQNGTETETDQQEESGLASFVVSNVTAKHSGRYICTAKLLNSTRSETVDVRVIYMRDPVINGNTTVEKGGVLNLTCSVESFPSSQITWMMFGSDTNLLTGSDVDLQDDTASASLVIQSVGPEHSGQYTCAAKHMDKTVQKHVDVNVIWFPEILTSSGCEVQSGVLTCVCASEGFPLPTIDWPLVKKYMQYSVTNTVSNYTISSSLTLTLKDHSNNDIECVSSNENGVMEKNLSIQMKEPQVKEVLPRSVSWIEVCIAFLIGVLLTAVICCLAVKCYSKKHKSSSFLNNPLEMMRSQEDPLIDGSQAVEDDQTYYQEAAEGNEGTDLNNGPTDVEYANINFAALQRKIARDPAKTRESTETEYAEIKKGVKEEREDQAEEEGEGLEEKKEVEGENEEEQVVVEGEEEEEAEKVKQCVPEEEEGEDTAVYSNVKAIMGEV